MYSAELNDFIEDCFIAKDPICNFKKTKSIMNDPLTKALIQEMIDKDKCNKN